MPSSLNHAGFLESQLQFLSVPSGEKQVLSKPHEQICSPTWSPVKKYCALPAHSKRWPSSKYGFVYTWLTISVCPPAQLHSNIIWELSTIASKVYQLFAFLWNLSQSNNLLHHSRILDVMLKASHAITMISDNSLFRIMVNDGVSSFKVAVGLNRWFS